MMRRKKTSTDAKEQTTPATVDPNAPPKRPLALDGARVELALQTGLNVASGYGFGDGKDRESKWRLFVFTNDKDVELPAEFQGFPVARRSVPVISDKWGKGRR